MPDLDPYTTAAAAASELRRLTGVERHDVAVVLGSGWGDAADALGEVRAEARIDALPGVPLPTVGGHKGVLRTVGVGRVTALVLSGRSHLYEGYGPSVVVHAVRTAILAGCTTVVLTNAAGSLVPDWGPGTVALIADHLNLTGTTPLAGAAPPEEFGPRFVDMTDAYDPALRELAHEVDGALVEGVYAGLLGGAYETPAEIRMLRGFGADLVGMSTVLETIAARHLGARVLGISLVTNLAAGISPTPLDHTEVLAAGRAAAPRVVDLLRGVLERL